MTQETAYTFRKNKLPVDLRLTISKELYKQLEDKAGEQGVEEYIKQLIENSLAK